MSKEVKLSNKTVTLREPVVRDLLMLDNVTGASNKEVELVSSLSELTRVELEAMGLKDYKKIQVVVQSFLD